MLTAHNLSKAYGLSPILENITFSISAGERVGLIGPNGCGKSTLMRLLIGQERPDSGSITLNPPNLRIGYLAQGFLPDENQTLGELLHQTVGNPDELEAELGELALALAERPNQEQIQLAYDGVLDKLNRADYGRIQPLLATFQLDYLDPDLPVRSLSGGQKTRLALVLILLDEPQLLLLDEPTNHLDIGMLEWLEAWLRGFNGGVLIVSHDRAFLDQTTTRILDLNPYSHTIREYPGNYTDYLRQYLVEQEKHLSAWKDQLYEIRRMKQDIQRTFEQARSVERSTTPRQPNVRRLAKKVAQKAKSREKKLDRYLESDERVEKPLRSWQMKLDLDEAPHLGKDVLFLEDLAIGYPGHVPLLTQINLQAQAGERIILTGVNGSGKTTLLRTIAGQLEPQAGRVRLGYSVQLGYMAQEQELLDPDDTPLSTIQTVAPLNETDTRSFLHYFLFTGDDSLRPNGQLSYGERARLALARLVASGCNFLLLDEPTNHLDIPSRTMFEEALSQFEGTILAVVHDRYFIEQFATKLWLVNDGQLELIYV
ncbi:ribosomal protection-like ABC-F family protein [Candidatus Leptofilum sp.]|uniref:ribosomal protection-like ABC-F family protein n=1 Tax=Candidatus Leptofilum sp. TaxID=3241576 RepID=UPI003B592AAE